MKIKFSYPVLALTLLITFLSYAQKEQQTKEVRFTIPTPNSVTAQKDKLYVPPVVKKDTNITNREKLIQEVSEQEALPYEIDYADPWSKSRSSTYNDLTSACNVAPETVTDVNLSYKGYKSLPNQLLQFRNLKKLKFGDPIFFMPEEVTNWQDIRYLDISSCSLLDLPKGLFQLKNLEYLNISSNNIGAIPPELKNLKNLKYLYIDGKTIIPKEISELTKLELLNIGGYYSDREGKPDLLLLEDITNLVNLKELNISTEVSTIPLSFANLKNLEKLTLMMVGPIEIADVFGSLDKLESISISEKVSGGSATRVPVEFPASFGKLPNLTSLRLGGFKIDKIGNVIGKLPELKTLDISNCDISELPISIGLSENLSSLSIFQANNLKKLPKEINKLIRLERLTIGNTELQEIPDISNLQKLKTLNITNSKLSKLHSSIGKLTNLERVSLSSGNLTELPKEIGDVPYLSSLHVSDNKLKALPKELGNCLLLDDIDFSKNVLKSIPDELTRCRKMRSININENELTILPESIGSWTTLSTFYAENNKITNIPVGFGEMNSLYYLKLKNNNISTLPSDFMEMKNINTLDLSNNKLTALPALNKGWKNLSTLNLSNNLIKTLDNHKFYLTGIRASEGRYASEHLDLSGNPITSVSKELYDWFHQRQYGRSQAIYNLVH